MTEPYRRTYEQKQGDYHAARIWEEEVGALFDPSMYLSRFNSVNDLDIWFPGLYFELKEKKQNYGERWHLLPGVPQENLFIIDELTVRRSLKHYPEVVFLIRDVPGGRLFHAPIWELIAVERVRVNRVGKGKWIIDLTNFRTVATPVESYTLAITEFAAKKWLESSVQSDKEIPQV